MAYVITSYKYTFANAHISRFWSSNPNFQAVSKQAFSKKVVFGSGLMNFLTESIVMNLLKFNILRTAQKRDGR